MELWIHHRASPFVRKALLAGLELGVEWRVRVVDLGSPAALDAYARVNPNRRFPALRDGELVIWESGAILRYLAATRDPAWLGRTPAEAARVDQWMFWELAHLGPALLGLQNARLGFLPKPGKDEDALVADCERALAVLDGGLTGRRYLAGDAITVADLAVASLFTYAEEASLVPPGYDAITRWLAALRERDSWRATERMKREALAAYGIDLSTRRAPVERGSLDAAERGG
ncbi:MAG: glutathione S-transferase family protein [Myxococcales bacterium]|nr:glutathione S-transferase family protein [Myxococcales bacterium]